MYFPLGLTPIVERRERTATIDIVADHFPDARLWPVIIKRDVEMYHGNERKNDDWEENE